MKPRCIARIDARPRICVLPDGGLLGAYVSNDAHRQHVMALRSSDGGSSWSDPEALFPLDDEAGRWAGCEVLVDRRGEIHLFLLNDAYTGVIDDPSGEGEIDRSALAARRLDIWHARGRPGRWQPPRRIWEGYTGALNSVIQMDSGRILLPFSRLTGRTWARRGTGLDAFWYVGQFSSTLVYSDDSGETWLPSPAELNVHTPSIGLYGGCEPVVIQLADGRVWMLIRTQLGRFYESFSTDGIAWTPPRPSALLSSDSPAGLVRLPDGRLVLLWNKCLRFPYAHGGRHVLHAAISEDEGRSWIGHREVVRDPLNHQPPPPRGDHGTAYPFPTALPDGRVIMTTGQGAGRVQVVVLEPDWLYETRQEDRFACGLPSWSHFGCRGVETRQHPTGQESVLSLRRVDPEWPAAAVWNFPHGTRGRVVLDLLVEPGAAGVHLLLMDHFSVPFEPEDRLHALFQVDIAAAREETDVPRAHATEGEGGMPLTTLRLSSSRWHTVEIRWDISARIATLDADGEAVGRLPLLHQSSGVCYLRLRSMAEGSEEGGLLVDRVRMERLDGRSRGEGSEGNAGR